MTDELEHRQPRDIDTIVPAHVVDAQWKRDAVIKSEPLTSRRMAGVGGFRICSTCGVEHPKVNRYRQLHDIATVRHAPTQAWLDTHKVEYYHGEAINLVDLDIHSNLAAAFAVQVLDESVARHSHCEQRNRVVLSDIIAEVISENTSPAEVARLVTKYMTGESHGYEDIEKSVNRLFHDMEREILSPFTTGKFSDETRRSIMDARQQLGKAQQNLLWAVQYMTDKPHNMKRQSSSWAAAVNSLLNGAEHMGMAYKHTQVAMENKKQDEEAEKGKKEKSGEGLPSSKRPSSDQVRNERRNNRGELESNHFDDLPQPEGVPGRHTPELENGVHDSGKLYVKKPKLTVRYKGTMASKSYRPSDFGYDVRYMNRWAADKRVFAHKRKGVGEGTVLIDGSGSMHLEVHEVDDIIKHLPGATIAIYSGQTAHGTLTVIAANGKRGTPQDIGLWNRAAGGGNIVDVPALLWLFKQRKPHIWVCDGYVTGRSDSTGERVAKAAAVAIGRYGKYAYHAKSMADVHQIAKYKDAIAFMDREREYFKRFRIYDGEFLREDYVEFVEKEAYWQRNRELYHDGGKFAAVRPPWGGERY